MARHLAKHNGFCHLRYMYIEWFGNLLIAIAVIESVIRFEDEDEI